MDKMKIMAQLMGSIANNAEAVKLLSEYLSLDEKEKEAMVGEAKTEKKYDKYIFCVVATTSNGVIVKHPLVTAAGNVIPNSIAGYKMVVGDSQEECEELSSNYSSMLYSMGYRSEIVGISSSMYDDLCERLNALLTSIYDAIQEAVDGPLARVSELTRVNIDAEKMLSGIISKMKYAGTCINGDKIEERQDEDYEEEKNPPTPAYDDDEDYEDDWDDEEDDDDWDEDEDEDDWDDEDDEY